MEVINIPRVGSSSLLQVPDSVHNNFSPHTLAMSPQSKSKEGENLTRLIFPHRNTCPLRRINIVNTASVMIMIAIKRFAPKNTDSFSVFFSENSFGAGPTDNFTSSLSRRGEKKTNCGHFVTRVVWFCFSARKFLLKLILICCL